MLKTIMMRSALIALTCSLSLSVYAVAESPPQPISIPAGDLATALELLSRQSGIDLVYRPEHVQGFKTKGVQGQLSAETAATKLLEGTPLTLSTDPTGAMLIAAPLPASGALSDAGELKGQEAKRGRFNWLRMAQNDSVQSDTPANPDASSTGTKEAPALEEIVVTAEKRAESAHSLPIAISAFSGETLADRGIGGLENLPQLAPSLQVLIQPGQDVFLGMRGVSNEIFGGEPSVEMNWDGVSYANTYLFAGDFFDVERIEVLRGPQGTISGRNATAGAIHIHSNRPTEDFEGGVKATYGNYDRLGTEGYLSGPIAGDRLMGRLAVKTDRADGWVTNTVLNQELGAIDKVIVRPSFLARVGENFEAHLILEGLRDRSTPLRRQYVDVGRLRPDTPTLTEFLGVPEFDWDNRTTQLDHRYLFDKDRYSATLRLVWDMGPSAQLTTITGYVDQDQELKFDNDSTNVRQTVHNKLLVNDKQMSQEITLTADLTERLDMIAGVLYLDGDHEQAPTDIELPRSGLSIVETRNDNDLISWAGYTQWRYRLTDVIRLTAGARYTHDKKDAIRDQSINNGPLVRSEASNSWDAWTPRFSVDYAPSDDLTLYATVSRGFKSGGVPFTGSFDPEFVWNYEVGAKADWLEGRLKTALIGFYMDYTDLQQFLFFFDPIQGGVVSRVTNAESATNAGIEWEVEALVTDELRFSFAGTWLDATYGELQDRDTLFPELGAPLPENPSGPNVRDLSGNRLVRAPEWQFNVSGEYRAPLGRGFLGLDLQGVLNVSYAWQDEVFFDIFNRQGAGSQGAYGLLNLFGAIETTDGRWQVSAYANNLTDEHYFTQKLPVIGALPVPYVRAEIGDARRYGIGVAYRF